jgi:hypothetical protein
LFTGLDFGDEIIRWEERCKDCCSRRVASNFVFAVGASFERRKPLAMAEGTDSFKKLAAVGNNRAAKTCLLLSWVKTAKADTTVSSRPAA